MIEALGKQGLEYDFNQRVIVCRDKGNKQKYTANNNNLKRVLYYRIDNNDNGMITQGKRCDFGLAVYEITVPQNALYLIELKGSDLEKAASQINATISFLSSSIRDLGLMVKARIVLNKAPSPKIKSSFSEYRKLVKSIGKYGGNIKEKTREMAEDI